MKFFKKVLIAFLSIGLLTVPSHKNVETVEAATITGGTELFLKPNSNWKQSSAWFSVYFWNSSGNTWAKMEICPRDEGIYKVTVPSGSWNNLIYCRMNSSKTATGWSNVWNQTSDLTYDGSKNLYSIAEGAWSKGPGSWSVFTETPEQTPEGPTLDESKETAKKALDEYVSANINYGNYSDNNANVIKSIIETAKTNIENAKTVDDVNSILANAKEDIDAVKTLDEEEKTNTFYYYNSESWSTVNCYAWDDSNNPVLGSWPGTAMIPVEGKDNWYSIECTYTGKSVNIIFNNGEGTQTAEIKGLTTDKYFYGKEIDGYDSFDDVEHASAVKFEVGSNIYFAPNNNWRSDNARFAAYFYGTSHTWTDLVDTDSNGVYETTVPEGDWTHVIFCRMNPSFTENRWNNEGEDPKPVWNKTGDIAVSEGNNYYSLDEGSWDTGKWLKYEDYNFMTHGDKILLRAVPWIKNRETNSVAVKLWSNSDATTWLPMTYIENTSYFEITVPDAGVYNEFKFAQMSGSDESKFESEYILNNNYTNDIKYNSTYNVYEIPDNYEGGEATTCTFKNTKVGTGYYVPTDVKAELGFTYSYNDSTGEITGVENMKMRLSSDYISLDSFVNINVNDITGYGMRIAKGNDISVGTKIQTWTNSQIGKFTYDEETKEYTKIEGEEVPTHIRWALTIENIPNEYYTGEFTYECFIVINEVEYTISNTRTVSVTNLAKTYAGMEGIREDHKEACQYIVDTYALAA